MLKKYNNFFFVGIGGVGMSGLAKILLKSGKNVAGSDIQETDITKELQKLGAKVFIGHSASNLNIGKIDALVVSAAIKDNPEVKEAQKKNIPVFKRSELLGFLLNEKRGIAIAGTHGKTTTSTLVSLILEKAGFDPTVVIGGEVKNIGGNAKYGKGEYFVAEACEYEKAILDLKPYASIITNIEEDHLDSYKDLDDIIDTFKKFVLQTKNGGLLVVSNDDFNIPKIIPEFKGELITYGIKSDHATWLAKDLKIENGETLFTAYKNSQKIGEFTLKIPGIHNISNALGAIALTSRLGVNLGVIKEVLKNFEGVNRRFQLKGTVGNVTVIDDYGHHPTEIRATLSGLRSIYPDKTRSVWCVFQPHQHSRTKFLMKDFASSFRDAEHVMVPDIYAVRDTEEDIKSVSSQTLVNEINKVSKNALYVKSFKEAALYLSKHLKEGDIVLTMGAGPVYKTGEALLSLLKKEKKLTH